MNICDRLYILFNTQFSIYEPAGDSVNISKTINLKNVGNWDSDREFIETDDQGTVYIAREKRTIVSGKVTDVDISVEKYDLTGNYLGQWLLTNIPPRQLVDFQVDNAGNVYFIQFEASQVVGGKPDYYIAKYNKNGQQQWDKKFRDDFSGSIKDFTVDPYDGSIYIGGDTNLKYSNIPTAYGTGLTAVFSSLGHPLTPPMAVPTISMLAVISLMVQLVLASLGSTPTLRQINCFPASLPLIMADS